MYGYVYLTTCNSNDKKYIGCHKYSSPSIDENYFGSGKTIRKAIKKYGKSNFSCIILEFCDTKDEMYEREKFYISKYDAVNSNEFYNIALGGKGSHQYSCQEDTRKILSEKQKNHITVNNGDQDIVINKDDLDQYIENGYSVGRLKRDYSNRVEKFKETHYSMPEEKLSEWKRKLSSSISGRRWVKNDFEEKQVTPEEFERYILNGYTTGRLFAKGKLKGLTTIESIGNEKYIAE